MTRRDERLAGWIALLTAALLGLSLRLHGAGPRGIDATEALAWYDRHALAVRAGALVWLLAMLCLVAFAVLLRDALLGLLADRWWVGVLFVQGAAVFATVAVIAAATAWTAAVVADGGEAEGGTVAALYTLHRTLLRFATWGLAVPLGTAALALVRHSRLGKVAAAGGVLVALALLVPPAWGTGLRAFAVWLALTGVTLLGPRLPARLRRLGRRRRRRPPDAADQDALEGPRSADG